ncbi:hypothetical protein T310_0014 [Rasamsonia emersonii CBS 393.64]|uniref:Alcohol dehydrogenase-like N-terminal domain-containing protein n=1 Tax=Rasamsonia emersonii (strain ATCC 16479 / CBS 393.64 / IMI 116815) TaxID=1408163 RepID=A0A0F4Z614_RASE3|nr:hypothetical protein T310_0014 [Rasamsonia emersonii CBS 393.64]KKA25942.1 hypothetical protein T310_0014 [Rasamsonia emersonii CBS 393.64]
MQKCLLPDNCMAVKSYRVCWTDLHIYNGDYDARMPVVTGHETSRIVDKIGANLIEFKIASPTLLTSIHRILSVSFQSQKEALGSSQHKPNKAQSCTLTEAPFDNGEYLWRIHPVKYKFTSTGICDHVSGIFFSFPRTCAYAEYYLDRMH